MTHWFAHFAKADDGSALIDRFVVMTGVVLMAVSIVVAVVPPADDVTDDGPARAERVEENRPA